MSSNLATGQRVWLTFRVRLGPFFQMQSAEYPVPNGDRSMTKHLLNHPKCFLFAPVFADAFNLFFIYSKIDFGPIF